MNKILIFYLLSFSISFWKGECNAFAQNLVPNSSFETFSSCPTTLGQIYLATPWYDATNASSDYYNQCNTDIWGVPNNWGGSQMANSGFAHAGFSAFAFNNLHEYTQVKLIDTLHFNKRYRVKFYLNLADSCQYAVSGIGAYLSISAVSDTPFGVLPVIPQIVSNPDSFLVDKNGWQEIVGFYIANGGENYLTIGNFNDNQHTDTLFVGGSASVIASYYFIDDVSVIEDSTTGQSELEQQDYKIIIYPNPSNGKFSFNSSEKIEAIEIYNVLGEKVFCSVILNSLSEIDLNEEPDGVYFYKVKINDEEINGKVLIIK